MALKLCIKLYPPQKKLSYFNFLNFVREGSEGCVVAPQLLFCSLEDSEASQWRKSRGRHSQSRPELSSGPEPGLEPGLGLNTTSASMESSLTS